MGACQSNPYAIGPTPAKSSALPRDNAGRVDLLQLLPCTDPRLPSLLISGGTSNTVQESFADKAVEQRGARGLDALGQTVGFACKKGQKDGVPNQDNFLILRSGGIGFYGVFDGHGEHGHAVSSFVASCITQHLACNERFSADPGKALRSAFIKVQDELVARQKAHSMDCSLSGTTATFLVDRHVKGGARRLCVAHCGDSRAVLGCWPGKNETCDASLLAMDLTHDHKPGLEAERKRIVAAGGVVRRQKGDPNDRVFLRDKVIPGLAMSRSLGDTLAASVGVISEPDVSVSKVQDGWRFVLICSDGVWEFISSQEAVEFVGRYPPAKVQTAANDLAAEARSRWLQNEGDTVDDITVICLWLV